MELPVGLPVLSAQCYSPSPDHGFEGRRGVSSSRQPLQESTGNIQHPHMAWYAQHLEALSSIPSSIPPAMPPVLRTQPLGPDYGAPAYDRSQQRHEVHSHSRQRTQGSNPLMPLLTKDFQNYRKKQEDKPDQKWPEVLEGFFLDALLLIPQIGRSKYTMKQQTNGRNQLIGEYLWIACCHGLSPGAELDPHVLEVKARGGRKKVSSHIQVLRNFFSAHRCFHFLFGPRQRDKEDIHVEKGSLKNNPVLIALSEGRIERPNYEYFARIFALNEQVQFRPKRCWIFVSHPDVVVSEYGSGYLPATDGKLVESEYPHLPRNLQRETWAKEEQQLFKGALLHEFTKEIHQVESSSVSSFSKKWASASPDLQQRLKNITSSTTDAKCDILHLHATLELKEKRSFPAESNLSSWVEINIEQPRLLNHRWRVETRLVRPPELSYSHDDSHGISSQEDICERHKEFTIKYQHQPGCDGSRNSSRGHCECLSQRNRRDGVSVPFPIPFPATAWAQTITNCAEYPAHPFSGNKRHDRERGAAVKMDNDDEDGRRSRRRIKQPTQMDLVPRISMMQEVFSCPPTSPHEVGSSNAADQRWTRRAVILWTFETIHSIVVDKNKKEQLVTAPNGRTNWRFLTILDPASEQHQRQAVASSRRASADEYRGVSDNLACSSRPASRAAALSPSPTYQQHLGTGVNENFSAWDNGGGLSSFSGPAVQAYSTHFMSHAIPPHTAVGQGSYGLLDSFSSHSNLATPPPNASMASSFAQPFNTASTSSDMLSDGYMVTHGAVTSAGMDPGSHNLGGSLSAVTDPFLSHVGAAYGGSQDNIHGIQGWDGHGVMGGIDAAASWSSGYSNHSAVHSVHSGSIDWSGSQPATVPSRRGSEHQHQPHHRADRPPWAPQSHAMDDHGAWTPMASEPPRVGSQDSHHHHHDISSSNPHHSHHSHHPNQHDRYRQQRRKHSHPPHTHTDAPSLSSTSTGSGSDISQEWEKEMQMHALPGSGSGSGSRSVSTGHSPSSPHSPRSLGPLEGDDSLGSLELAHAPDDVDGGLGREVAETSLGVARAGLKRRWEEEEEGEGLS